MPQSGLVSRIVVVGNSASGKTTVARRIGHALDLPCLELDAVFHQPGWTELSNNEFQTAVANFVAANEWVVDGNYTSHGMGEVVWPRADTIVWLDMPKAVVMRWVIARTLRRVLTREELWNGNREPWTNLYHRDPERNIVVWAWTRFDHVREKYVTCMTDGTWDHASVHRLRIPRDVDDFLASIERDASIPQG